MDHALQTISYIADIGSVLVIMARRRLARRLASQAHGHRLYKMICHVFHSDDVSSRAPVSGCPHPPVKPTWPRCHPTALPWSSVLAGLSTPPIGPTYSSFFRKTVRLVPNPETFPAPGLPPDFLRQWPFSQNPCRLVSWESCPWWVCGLDSEDVRGFGGPEGGWDAPWEMLPILHRPSSLLRPSARPLRWPTASFCGKAALTPARWAPSQARGPWAPATSTMGTSTTSPTARTARR